MAMKHKLLPISLFRVSSCTQQPKTSSFRLTTTPKDDIYKTINSVYFDPEADTVDRPDSWFTNSSETGSLSTTDHDESSMSISGDSHLEEIVRGAQQSSSVDHRIFFEPSAEDTLLSPSVSNVHSLTPNKEDTPFKESVAMSMESEDPYEDFKRSMEEMVGLLEIRDDWEGLEELLGWYLKVNGRKNHGHIIGAFVHLLASTVDTHINSSNRHDINGHVHDDREITRSSNSFKSAHSCLSSSACTSDHIKC